MAQQKSNNLIATLEPFFAKAPSLPKNAKDVLVKVLPWIALIFGILGILSGISALGIFTVFSPLALLGGVDGAASYGTGFIYALIALASAGLLLAAYPGLSKRSHKGWDLLFWSEIVGLVGAIVSTAIVTGVIGALIGLYLLYQVKSYYK